jgi:hypothetical protein
MIPELILSTLFLCGTAILCYLIVHEENASANSQSAIKRKKVTIKRLSISQLICGIVAAFLFYWSGYNQSTQLNVIDETGKRNEKLTELSNAVVSLNSTLLETNNLLIDSTKKIGEQTQSITKKINELTNQSSKLLSIIDSKTDEEFKITGELNFNKFVDTSYKNAVFKLGGFTNYINSKSIYNTNDLNYFVLYSGFKPLIMQVHEGNLVLSGKIFDINNNLLVEFKNNYWRLNKYYVGKFNFDEYGIEIFDNKGRVAFSVDIQPQNIIMIQGLVLDDANNFILVLSENGANLLNVSQQGIDTKILHILSEKPFKQLFEYTDEKWHGKRL